MSRRNLTTLEQSLPPLKPSEVAKLLNVLTKTVTLWCQQGKIAATKLPGGHWRIARSVVAEFLPDETPEQFEGERARSRRIAAALADIEKL